MVSQKEELLEFFVVTVAAPLQSLGIPSSYGKKLLAMAALAPFPQQACMDPPLRL